MSAIEKQTVQKGASKTSKIDIDSEVIRRKQDLMQQAKNSKLAIIEQEAKERTYQAKTEEQQQEMAAAAARKRAEMLDRAKR